MIPSHLVFDEDNTNTSGCGLQLSEHGQTHFWVFNGCRPAPTSVQSSNLVLTISVSNHQMPSPLSLPPPKSQELTVYRESSTGARCTATS